MLCCAVPDETRRDDEPGAGWVESGRVGSSLVTSSANSLFGGPWNRTEREGARTGLEPRARVPGCWGSHCVLGPLPLGPLGPGWRFEDQDVALATQYRGEGTSGGGCMPAPAGPGSSASTLDRCQLAHPTLEPYAVSSRASPALTSRQATSPSFSDLERPGMGLACLTAFHLDQTSQHSRRHMPWPGLAWACHAMRCHTCTMRIAILAHFRNKKVFGRARQHRSGRAAR